VLTVKKEHQENI